MVNMADGLVTNKIAYSSYITKVKKMQTFDDYTLGNLRDAGNNCDEDDIHPFNKPPVPSWRGEIYKSTDPKLTLTPERPSKSCQQSIFCEKNIPPLVKVTAIEQPDQSQRDDINHSTDAKLVITPEHSSKLKSQQFRPFENNVSAFAPALKQKQRVRFELDGNMSGSRVETPLAQEDPNINLVINSPSKSTPKKEYCPKMYSSKPDQDFVNDKYLDVSQTENDSSSNSRPTSAENCNSRPSSAEQSFTETALKFLTVRESEYSKQEPPQIIDSVPAHVRKCHAVKNIIVTREFENKLAPNGYQFPFVSHTIIHEEAENVLARPEYNTTLKISEELKDLKASKPKIAMTLKQKLQESEETRTEINEKASVKVNCSRDQFSGLVGVDPDINKISLDIERDITHKARPKSSCKSSSTNKKSNSKIPDILEFYTDDRQREIPDLCLTGIAMPTEVLSTADPATAFDLYRHNKVWETLNN